MANGAFLLKSPGFVLPVPHNGVAMTVSPESWVLSYNPCRKQGWDTVLGFKVSFVSSLALLTIPKPTVSYNRHILLLSYSVFSKPCFKWSPPFWGMTFPNECLCILIISGSRRMQLFGNGRLWRPPVVKKWLQIRGSCNAIKNLPEAVCLWAAEAHGCCFAIGSKKAMTPYNINCFAFCS